MCSRYGLEIRAAASGDAPGLAELLAEVRLTVEPAAMAARIEALQRDGGTALVALEWGPPIGLVVVSPYRTLTLSGPVGLITTLVVARAFRRRGVGRLLVKAVAHAARQACCERLFLHAEPGMADLQAFCTATGFAEAGMLLGRPLLRRGAAVA